MNEYRAGASSSAFKGRIVVTCSCNVVDERLEEDLQTAEMYDRLSDT